MELILSSAGSYPRIGATSEAQRHRRAYAQRERGEISDAEWRAVEDEVAEQVVREQTVVGLDVVTDGLVRWYDPISHLARHWDGIQVNGLLRYNLDLAISHSALDLLAMFEKNPFTKDLSLGVLDVHTHTVEAVDEVRARIRRGSGVLPADRIWVDPDCGLKTRTVEESRAKLAAMMSAVRAARAELA